MFERQDIKKSTDGCQYCLLKVLLLMLMVSNPALCAVSQVFERQDIKDSTDGCQYRLAQEGLPFMLQYVSKQRVQLSRDDFLLLLNNRLVISKQQAGWWVGHLAVQSVGRLQITK